jgi:hypothetical protein
MENRNWTIEHRSSKIGTGSPNPENRTIEVRNPQFQKVLAILLEALEEWALLDFQLSTSRLSLKNKPRRAALAT